MPFSVRCEVEGLQDAANRLRALPKNLAKKTFRKAVGEATKTILWKARKDVPVRYQILKKSLGRKVKVYPSGVMVGIVGARVGFRQAVGTKKRDSRPGTRYPAKAGSPIYANPVKYLHLVELGTQRSKAYGFLKKALAKALTLARGQFLKALDDGLAKAVKK